MKTNEWATPCMFSRRDDGRVLPCFGGAKEYELMVDGDTMVWVACSNHAKLTLSVLQKLAETNYFEARPWLSREKPRRLERASA